MNEYQISHLLLSISIKREEMVFFAETKGLNEHLTLKASQELDELIISYQKKLLSLNKSFSMK
ncbi:MULTISPECIES: aspartyl-phosphate phosphatase Spo0E family protein [unclassified Bacillus (in: firmicutes)]|uniref:aspartyl-phosphate phosphatase Spo0E family protein n=1 Tax=unclassified Bacillus (in: firmicutes) TaxID=185979 RepID=UPI001155D670|nr:MULTISPECIES: aspartyl-phosphate phosphatase Spo0E family protein [unclassified Bacillus (in: firmicutes)]